MFFQLKRINSSTNIPILLSVLFFI